MTVDEPWMVVGRSGNDMIAEVLEHARGHTYKDMLEALAVGVANIIIASHSSVVDEGVRPFGDINKTKDECVGYLLESIREDLDTWSAGQATFSRNGGV